MGTGLYCQGSSEAQGPWTWGCWGWRRLVSPEARPGLWRPVWQGGHGHRWEDAEPCWGMGRGAHGAPHLRTA